ncbi:DUF2634 domain-containing protein [Paenibacillus sp. strain BS8-2]
MESLKMESGDLIIEGDDFVIIADNEEVVQCCRHEIATSIGEWFLNPEMGINQELFVGNNLDEEVMRSELTQAILRDPRVSTVEDITFEMNRQSRTLFIKFSASGPSGEVYEGEVDQLA